MKKYILLALMASWSTVSYAQPLSGSSSSVELGAGNRLPVIHVTKGMSTAISFSDRSGTPWPVVAVESKAVKANIGGEKGKSNIVIVSPETNKSELSTVMIRLANRSDPVILKTEINSGLTDYRIDMNLK